MCLEERPSKASSGEYRNMIIVINLVNNTAQEVTTVVFVQVANRKMRQEKFVALSVQSLKESENCFVTI